MAVVFNEDGSISVGMLPTAKPKADKKEAPKKEAKPKKK